MNNAGTHGDITWIIWMIALPYIIWFLGDIICKLYAISPSKTVYVKQYVDRPVKTVYRRITQPQQIVAREPKTQQTRQTQQTQTDPIILKEAVEGLTSLGAKRSRAKKIVQDIASRKNYSSVEELLGDCFPYL